MESIWQKSTELPAFPQLSGSMDTDVLIIGGGIAGILTAYFLKQSGADCILVEKGRICQGTTSHTTAKITYQHGLIYHKLLKSCGLGTAQKYLAANRLAFEKYEELCSSIDCDYEIKDNYVYSVSNREKLEAEISALDRIGYKAELCENVTLPFPTVGAVKFPSQAQFHPLKFIAAIAEGLPIYENTFVKEMRGNTAVTDSGNITARAVIVTTHFPFINKHVLYDLHSEAMKQLIVLRCFKPTVTLNDRIFLTIAHLYKQHLLSLPYRAIDLLVAAGHFNTCTGCVAHKICHQTAKIYLLDADLSRYVTAYSKSYVILFTDALGVLQDYIYNIVLTEFQPVFFTAVFFSKFLSKLGCVVDIVFLDKPCHDLHMIIEVMSKL